MAQQAFLKGKSWHPNTLQNQRAVWIAEQNAKEMKHKNAEREKELEEERELMKLKMLAKGDDLLRYEQQSSLSFMYADPTMKVKDKEMEEHEHEHEQDDKDKDKKRDPRFRDAPTTGSYVRSLEKDKDIVSRPLGHVVRRVKCRKCGDFGHNATDRECPMFSQPTKADRDWQTHEDPMSQFPKDMGNNLQLKGIAAYAGGIPSEGVDGGYDDVDVLAVLDGLDPEERDAFLLQLGQGDKEDKGSDRKKHKRRKSESKGKHHSHSRSHREHGHKRHKRKHSR